MKLNAALLVAFGLLLPACRSGVDAGPENDPNRRGYAFVAKGDSVPVFVGSSGDEIVDTVSAATPLVAWDSRHGSSGRSAAWSALRQENGRFHVRYWKGWTVDAPAAKDRVIGWVRASDVRAFDYDCCGDRHCEGVELAFESDSQWQVEKPKAFSSCFTEAWKAATRR